MGSEAGTTGCEELLWSDEFDVAGAPNPNRWRFETGGGGWGNNELQVYTTSRSNSYISDGTLKIHARKSETGTWTSARMVTSGKASWQYCRIEIRAKLPPGRGTWPALWMMPQQSTYGSWPKSGEIDIMEHVGYDMNNVHGTVHTEAYNHSIGTEKQGSILLTNVDKQFHVYTIEWNEKEIRWFANDRHYYTFSNEYKTYREWPFSHPFFLIFNLAIGGSWGGSQGVDPALTEAVMEIDYVRVYRVKPAPPVISGPAFVTPGQEAVYSIPTGYRATPRWIIPEGVSLVSGAGTQTIKVVWNDKPGTLTAELFNECDTVAGSPYLVKMLEIPSGEFWIIPFADSSGSTGWKAIPGANNNIALTLEEGDLAVTYNIQSAIQNPHLSFDFPITTDLTGHPEMVLQLMAAEGQMPVNLRIELSDAEGKTDPSDPFILLNATADGQFHPYLKSFSMNPANGWKPGYMSRIRLFFNYGIQGKKGAGEFRIRDLKMHNPTFTSGNLRLKNHKCTLYPNPSSGKIRIESPENILFVKIYSLSGQLRYSAFPPPVSPVLIDLSDLPAGVYFISLSTGSGRIENQLLVIE